MEINPMAGKGALQGEIIDLIERMRQALPPEVEVSKAEWLEARRAAAEKQSERAQRTHSSAPEPTGSSARIPREVPALPKGHVPRKAILDGILSLLYFLKIAHSRDEQTESWACCIF